MALQWINLSCMAVAEAAVAVLLTLPGRRHVQSRIVAFASRFLQPLARVLPFATFQLLDLRWKNEHRLICSGDVCTTDERTRYEKSHETGTLEKGLAEIFKAQRNAILCFMTCLLYWCIYRVCKYHKEIKELEEVEKRLKEQ